MRRQWKNSIKSMRAGILTAVVLLLMTSVLTACGGGTPTVTSADDEAVVSLVGLEDQPITVSVAELKEMKSVTKKAEAVRSNGQKVSVKATGPLLETVLEKYGKNKSDYNTIRFNASDGYSSAMPSDIVENDDIILAYYDKGKPFSSKDGPVRVVVPGQRAMYWVRMLNEISFETEAGAETPSGLVMLDTALSELPADDVDIKGETVSAVKTDDLIAAYADINDNTVMNVYMKASDGLSKNETKDNFMGAYLRVSGDDTPEFTGPDMADGMTVRGLVTINYGDTAFVKIEDSAAFSDLLKDPGMVQTDEYTVTTTAGNAQTFEAADLASALLTLNDDGTITLDPGDGTYLDGVLRIEAAE